MKLGTDLVTCGRGLAVYAKLTPTALHALTCRKRIGELDKILSKFTFTLAGRIKAGNKYLRKQGLDELVALSDEEIESLKRGESPPSGSLLCDTK